MGLFNEISALNIVVSLAILFATTIVTKALYNVTLHPLAKYPGPLTRAAFAFPGLWNTCKGQYVSDVWGIHKKYGPAVRIAPDAISFSTSGAWQDIYGLRDGRKQVAKDYKRFPDQEAPIHLFASNDEDHARIRRVLSHGFSSSALKDQEGLIDTHIKTLMKMLDGETNTKVDLNKWFDILTFDIMSHMTFGESFAKLPTGELDPFTVDLFGKFKMYNMIYLSREYDWFNWLLKMMMKLPSIAQEQERYFEGTKKKVEKRMRPDFPYQHDFMSYILRHNDESHENGMDHKEIIGTTTVLVNGGGQEMAVCLSTTVYYMLKHQAWLKKVQEEVRSGSSEGTSCIAAAINESMRLHPPAAGNFQRRTGKSGIVVEGHVIPPNTSVGVNQYAAFHSPDNFIEPESFLPERWLADAPEKFRNDNKAVYQPFSVGPRNCIGKNLALMIVTRTLEQLLEKFDVKLCDESKDWTIGQTFHVGWFRPPLYVVLKGRV